MDKIFGALVTLLTLACASVVIRNFNWSWEWVASATLTIGLGFWALTGLKKIEVGWKGQLLFLGQRMDATLHEGWRWVPTPFGVKLADCRQQILELDKLKAMTLDNIEVIVSATVTYRVANLNAYFGVEASGLKRGIDDVRDALIRARVRLMTLAETLSSTRELGEGLLSSLSIESGDWGIIVIRVAIPEILPLDKKVSEDLALRERERLQREGQLVEASHIAALTEFFRGKGLSSETAYEAALLVVGKADPKKVFSLDPATAVALATLLGRRP